MGGWSCYHWCKPLTFDVPSILKQPHLQPPATWIVPVGGHGRSAVDPCGRKMGTKLGFIHSSVSCVSFLCVSRAARQLECVGLICSRYSNKGWRNALFSQSLSLLLVDSKRTYLLWKPADKGRQSNLCPQRGRTTMWPASLKGPNSASWSPIQTLLARSSYTCRCSVPHLITRQWFSYLRG